MRIVITAIISLFVVVDVFATKQRPDRFLYEGKVYSIGSRELYMEHFFKIHPEKRPRSGLMSTALYRGYVATYEIKDSRLILNDIKIRTSHSPDKWKSVRNSIVPQGKPMTIDWFTGVIVLDPSNELINEKRLTPLSLNHGDIEKVLLQIENGRLDFIRKFTVGEYKKFKELQLAAFKKSEQYTLIRQKLLKKGTKSTHVDNVINNFLMYYSRKVLVDHTQIQGKSQNKSMLRTPKGAGN